LSALLNRPQKGAATGFSQEADERAKLFGLLDGHKGGLDEYESKRILKALEVPIVSEKIVGSIQEALTAVRVFGFPVVMKGVDPEIIHKTEANLVRLDITSEDQVPGVYEELKEAMGDKGRVLVQAQISGGLELIAGLVRDPQFGPCVMCGLGGVFAELIKDRVFAAAPLSHEGALALIGRLKFQELLNGFRGAEPVDKDALAGVLVGLSRLGVAAPTVSQVDINPLIVANGKPVAVDATIVVEDLE
jgi:acetyltransferase